MTGLPTQDCWELGDIGEMVSGRLPRIALATTFVVILLCALALFVTMVG